MDVVLSGITSLFAVSFTVGAETITLGEVAIAGAIAFMGIRVYRRIAK